MEKTLLSASLIFPTRPGQVALGLKKQTLEKPTVIHTLTPTEIVNI